MLNSLDEGHQSDIRDSRMSRSLSSGARSRDPLAHAGYNGVSLLVCQKPYFYRPVDKYGCHPHVTKRG